MATILFTTCDKWPNLSASDALVAAALVARGHQVQPVPWQADFARFQQADLIILRSHWDYHYDLANFMAWLDRLAKAGLPVYNPVELVRWNLEKGYLLDLQAKGVTIPVTEVLSAGGDPQTLYAKQGWERAVIKPLAGASGHLVERVAVADLAAWQARVRTQRAADTWLVQEFLPEIAAGEWSLVFFDGAFSHAIVKRPQAGEFRINSQYQGQITRATPAPAVLAQAQAVLQTLPTMPLYARVDGVITAADTFCLIELELNEPGLAFLDAPEQATHFAAAIARRLVAGA